MSAAGLGSRAIIGEYVAALEADMGVSWVPLVSNIFDVDQAIETYKWLGQSPALREWIGGRVAKTFRENGVSIENKHFEATMEVLVSEMRRDKTGQVMMRTRELAQRVNSHWAKLLSTLIIAGKSTACYDGQFFFDTDHAEHDSGTQDNDLTQAAATGTVPTAGEMADAIMAAIVAILGFKDDQGEPMNENAREFLVKVPLALLPQAMAAIGSTILVQSSTLVTGNVIQAMGSLGGFQIRLASNARFSSAVEMFTFRTDAPTKALIRQQETEPSLEAIAEGSEEEKKNKRHLYMVDTWRNVGYGLWQRAALTTFT